MLSLFANAGLAGLVALAFLKGWVFAKPSADRAERDATQRQKLHEKEIARLEKEAERWRLLHEKESSAHETTRRAHNEEIRPALQASTEAARTTAHLLTGVKQLQAGAGAGERP